MVNKLNGFFISVEKNDEKILCSSIGTLYQMSLDWFAEKMIDCDGKRFVRRNGVE
jgi:hypothetical protein